MKIDTEAFRVLPASKTKLSDLPTKIDPVYKSEKKYHSMLKDHVAALSDQQQLLYGSDRYALLLIFQAMDAAGKDGAISHVMSGVNPQGCEVFSFKHPSADELEHDFLWRTTARLPERGRIGIFNRSYYEEVLVVRVHPEILENEGLCPKNCATTKTSGASATAPSSTWSTISTATAPASSSSSCISRRTSSASASSRASTSRTRTGSSASPTSRSASSGTNTAGLRGLPRRHQHPARPVVRRPRRRQGQRAPHHLRHRPRHHQEPKALLPQDHRQAPRRAARHPQELKKK